MTTDTDTDTVEPPKDSPAPPRTGPPDRTNTTFRDTGPERIIARIKEILAEATGPVPQSTLLIQVMPLVDYRDAARAWMDAFRWRQPVPYRTALQRRLKRKPTEEEVKAEMADAPNPERVFSLGIGRPEGETQGERYENGRRLFVVKTILERRVEFVRVTGDDQPYPNVQGYRLGHPYWKLRPAAAKPKRGAKPRRKAPLALVTVPDAAEDTDDIKIITARIRDRGRGPLEQGADLRRVRDEQLYLGLDYATFDAYIEDNFDFTRQRAYQLIDAARVVEKITVSTMVDTNRLLPESERQARALVPLLDDDEKLVRAWQIVLDAAPQRRDGTRKLTAQLVTEVVEKLTMPPPPPPEPPPPPPPAPIVPAEPEPEPAVFVPTEVIPPPEPEPDPPVPPVSPLPPVPPLAPTPDRPLQPWEVPMPDPSPTAGEAMDEVWQDTYRKAWIALSNAPNDWLLLIRGLIDQRLAATAFHCPHCGTTLPDWFVKKLADRI